MPLSGLFHQSSSEETKPILYLAFADQSVQAQLLQMRSGTAEITQRSSQEQFADEDAAVVRTDECLQQLGPESESVNEVLLGLDPNWLHNGEIAQDKKAFLKRIFTELSLQPLGFISFAEAVAQSIAQQHPNAAQLLAYCSETAVVLVSIENGVIERAESIGRSADIVSDFTEGLTRFTSRTTRTHVPSSILLASFALSDEQLTDLQQALLTHDWSTTTVFLQAPVVSLLEHDATIQAVADEALVALQEVPESTAVEKTQPKKAIPSNEDTANVTPVAAATAFSVPNQEERAIEEEHLPKSFGVPIGHQEKVSAAEKFGTLISDDATELANDPELEKSTSPELHNKHLKRSIVIGVVAGVLALVILTVAASMFLTSAVVTVSLAQTPISEEVEITLDPAATDTNVSERVLRATIIEEQVTGDGVAQTTGVKIVGERAQGSVVIYNKTEQAKTFDAGTVLSVDTVEYRTTESVTVPAAKVQEETNRKNIEYGQATVQLEADKIGDDANKPKDTELKVAAFANSTYSATAPEGFSGGTSREVRVVAEKDRTDLLAEVTRKVLDQANTDFKSKSGSGTYILPTTTISVSEVQYDAEVESEANTLSLEITAVVSALSYSSADLQPIADTVLESKIPEGYTLAASDPQILSAPVQQSAGIDEAVQLKANISSYVVPPVQEELWKTAIEGKSIQEAESSLTALQEVATADIMVQPSILSAIVRTVPSSVDRITVQILSEE